MGKIRTGFVTNSSSTSYIILYNGDEETLRNNIKGLIDIRNELKDDYDLVMPEIWGWEGEYFISPDYRMWELLSPFFEMKDDRND